jgi:hypothetical protein
MTKDFLIALAFHILLFAKSYKLRKLKEMISWGEYKRKSDDDEKIKHIEYWVGKPILVFLHRVCDFMLVILLWTQIIDHWEVFVASSMTCIEQEASHLLNHISSKQLNMLKGKGRKLETWFKKTKLKSLNQSIKVKSSC